MYFNLIVQFFSSVTIHYHLFHTHSGTQIPKRRYMLVYPYTIYSRVWINSSQTISSFKHFLGIYATKMFHFFIVLVVGWLLYQTMC